MLVNGATLSIKRVVLTNSPATMPDDTCQGESLYDNSETNDNLQVCVALYLPKYFDTYYLFRYQNNSWK